MVLSIMKNIIEDDEIWENGCNWHGQVRFSWGKLNWVLNKELALWDLKREYSRQKSGNLKGPCDEDSETLQTYNLTESVQ